MDLNTVKQICVDTELLRGPYIYKIIESGILDNQIKKIKYANVQTSMYSTFKDGITDTYNLFVLNLDKFLMFFDLNFILKNTEKFAALSYILESKYTKIFISTKDVNQMHFWYTKQYKKLLIDNFFKTLKKIYSKNINKLNIIIDKAIDINSMSLRNENDIDEIFEFLKDLINCSRDNIRFLFFDSEMILNNSLYFEMYLKIFKNYQKRKKYLDLLGL